MSPDLVAGARVLAIVNLEDSPVAEASHAGLPLRAGDETSVAATKTFLASMAVAAQLVAELVHDSGFATAVDDLPRALDAAWGLDWSAAEEALADCENAFMVGRGTGLPAAAEMALKLKQTSAVSSEGVSSAEIMHGPLGQVRSGTPVLVIGQRDQSLPGIKSLARVLADKQARALAAYEGAPPAFALPVVAGLDPALAPLAAVQSFCRVVSGVSVERGLDPDRPEHLRRVTETRLWSGARASASRSPGGAGH